MTTSLIELELANTLQAARTERPRRREKSGGKRAAR
jgi:hypothetical protein